MLKYDTLWGLFLDISGIPREEIPDNEEEIKRKINNAILKFNTIKDDSIKALKCDDDLEEVSLSENDKFYFKKLTILSLLIKLDVCQNAKEYFENVYQYSLREVEPKFYKDQVSSRQATIDDTKKQIKQLFNDLRDYDY